MTVAGYLEPAGILLSNRRTRNQSAVTSSGFVIDNSETNKSAQTTKLQWGVGAVFRLTKSSSLVMDYVVLESEHYDDGLRNSETPQMHRIGLGGNYELNSQFQLLAGYQTTIYSANLNDPSMTSMYANFGVERKISFLQSQINLFYSRYAGEETKASIKTIGVAVGTSYAY